MTREAAVLQDDLPRRMAELGHAAHDAAHELALAAPETKSRALTAAAQAIRGSRAAILEANGRDMEAARAKGRKIGICGQAPSDYPEFAQFLVEQGIDSISLNPDVVLKTTVTMLETEKQLKTTRHDD